MERHPDQKYIDALINNDEALIRKIVTNCWDSTLRMVIQNSGTMEDGQDIFQDVFIKLRKQAMVKGIKLTTSFPSFFYIVAKRHWINILNRGGRQGVTFVDIEGYRYIGDKEKQDVLDAMRSDACLELIKKNLHLLGSRCQDFIKAKINGSPSKEIAEKFDTTVNYVNRKTSECYKTLRQKLKADPKFNESCFE